MTAALNAAELIPGTTLKGASCLLLVLASPLLEKERYLRPSALIAEIRDPSAIHRPRAGPDSPPTITQSMPKRLRAVNGPSSGSKDKNFTCATNPDAINIAFLEGCFPEVVEFRKARPKTDREDTPAGFNADGTWDQREGIEDRVRQMMEISIPDDPMRRTALHFLAAAIETADEERSDAWCLRDTGKGLRLMTGRLFACEVARSKMFGAMWCASSSVERLPGSPFARTFVG